jgi:spermidine synthase
MILDAFSGDAVPVHLLTREAFAMFARHLKPRGWIAVHVSNRFLDLEPVVAAAARQLGRVAYSFYDEGDPAQDLYDTRWILVVRSAEDMLQTVDREGLERLLVLPTFRDWTDDRSNLMALLK